MFRIFLPNAGGAGLEETPANYLQINSDLAENNWCAYAWPADPSGPGQAFFVNQGGEILRTSNQAQNYGGLATLPAFDAAFNVGGSIIGDLAPGVAAVDGGV